MEKLDEEADKSKMEEATELQSISEVKECDLKQELDEMTSLEEEIAKMHNVEPPAATSIHSSAGEDFIEAHATPISSSSVHEMPSNEMISTDVEKQQENIGIKTMGIILVSKEKEQDNQLKDEELIAMLKGTDFTGEQSEAQIDVGVTIEGEGQYEIMEIDDDEIACENELLIGNNSKNSKASATAFRIHNKNANAKSKMSLEEERALALEQIANLEKSKLLRRKQEIKPQANYLSSINNDWNDYDEIESHSVKASATTKPIKSLSRKMEPKITKPVEMPKANVTVLNSQSKQKPEESLNEDIESKTLSKGETETVGFKRTRIIKRKIIWDPDVPETQKSYAQYVSNSKVSGKSSPSARSGTPVSSTIKKETSKLLSPKKENRVKAHNEEGVKSPVVVLTKMETTKKRIQSPIAVANGASAVGVTIVKKKKNSELDRLMGDEGAANMIQAVEIEHRDLVESNSSSSIQCHKPFMRKRALTIAEKPIKSETVPNVTLKHNKDRTSPPKTKRTLNPPKPRPSGTTAWDFVYKQRTEEESMIIRRRSNSSYSSNASVQRLSLDKSNTLSTDDDESSDEPTAKSDSHMFEFAKPVNRIQKPSSSNNSPSAFAADLKRAVSGGAVARGTDKEKGNSPSGINDVMLKYHGRLAQLIINTQRSKVVNTYSVELLQKLSHSLNQLAANEEYNAVLVTGRGTQFCRGIDFHDLTAGSIENRKQSAEHLANALKTYLRTLATFPKPIVVAVNGNLKNLGVMQLALFDFVISTDKCTFEAPYARIGQIPEALEVFNATNSISTTIKRKLFLLGERLSLNEAGGLNGLVNKTTTAGKLQDESLAIAKKISETTADCYIMNKKFTNRARMEALKSLDEEIAAITEQWLSVQCQEHFINYIDNGHF